MSVSLGLIIVATPAAAVETCRFIEAKAEREACYHRQEQELAAKRKPEPPPITQSSESKTFDQLQQMRRDDEEVYRSMRGICRGC
ncbi:MULTISPECIES: type VI secretion protein [unclassified Bradyrhizobium]|uniref:type VI secretion protein n=1 Tax=unclassified Bradyrhizobium TaxID=2631580 RepID=UPI002011F730|nr:MULTISPECIES: type VI secretion protein [unclassified Bradyrhizobium]